MAGGGGVRPERGHGKAHALQELDAKRACAGKGKGAQPGVTAGCAPTACHRSRGRARDAGSGAAAAPTREEDQGGGPQRLLQLPAGLPQLLHLAAALQPSLQALRHQAHQLLLPRRQPQRALPPGAGVGARQEAGGVQVLRQGPGGQARGEARHCAAAPASRNAPSRPAGRCASEVLGTSGVKHCTARQ